MVVLRNDGVPLELNDGVSFGPLLLAHHSDLFLEFGVMTDERVAENKQLFRNEVFI